MKKLIVFFSLLVLATTINASVIQIEDLSVKAGPTESGEGLSLLWVEAYVFPKVAKDDKMISLGVRTTKKLQAVSATFDFINSGVALETRDGGTSWSGICRLPADVKPGLHVVRYTIAGSDGSIKRTVDFFVAEDDQIVEVKDADTTLADGWPLTVTITGSAVVDGSQRILYVGQNVKGISKVPWYKVLFEDGAVGWLPATMVKEPSAQYYAWGYQAYQNKDFATAINNYANAVAVNPGFVKGHFWLAKSHYKAGNLEAAYRSVKQAMRLDDRDIDSKILANVLASQFFADAHGMFRAGRYHQSVAAYQKALDLKPNSVGSWVSLGQSYKQLGLPKEARMAWREALKHDPENKQLYALLQIDSKATALAQISRDEAKPRRRSVALAAKPNKALPAVISDDSLAVLKSAETKKGTKVESALKSVIALTRSLGTPVIEKGWQVSQKGKKFLVTYLCEQGTGVLENFEWLVDVDTKHISASNANARLLMNRW